MNSITAAIITYNHRQYIERAIKGAVEQQFDGEYKILIHDDCSSDGTTTICRIYRDKYPALIELQVAEKNKGMTRSWRDAISACQTSYIAICEGDDYWIDEYKLQKQVDFLEANPEFSICCHRVYKKTERHRPVLYADEFAPSNEAVYDIVMMALYGNLVATPSVVFRNGLEDPFPAWFDKAPVADYVLHMRNSRYGRIKYLPEAMAVYREHAQGAWAGRSVKENAEGMIKVLELLLSEPFDREVKEGLRNQLRGVRASWLNELVREDWNVFLTEFNRIQSEDKETAIALIEKMNGDREALYRSRTYRAADLIKKITKG
jgi:glycosyltransferase involved in cell wall biosynthesis